MEYNGPTRKYTAENSETTAIGQFGRPLAKNWLTKTKFRGHKVKLVRGGWRRLDGDFDVFDGNGRRVANVRVKTEVYGHMSAGNQYPSIFVEDYVDAKTGVPGWTESRSDKVVYQILRKSILLYIDLPKLREWLSKHRHNYVSEEQSRTTQWNRTTGRRIPIDDLVNAGGEFRDMVEVHGVSFPDFEWIEGQGVVVKKGVRQKKLAKATSRDSAKKSEALQ